MPPQRKRRSPRDTYDAAARYPNQGKGTEAKYWSNEDSDYDYRPGGNRGSYGDYSDWDSIRPYGRGSETSRGRQPYYH